MEVQQVMEPQPGSGGTGPNSPGADESALFERGLPMLSTRLHRDELLGRLDAAARRGRLAGFERRQGPESFEVEAYSAPFDHVLLATAAQDAGGTRLSFRLRMLKKLPLIFAAIIVASIWPGLPLTHSMLLTYFSWYSHVAAWVTAAWYVPLTVVPLLWWVPKSIRKSGKEATEAAREQILKLRDLLDGTLTQG